MSGVRLSKKYGLNPSIQKCFCCGKEMGIVLFGTAWKDKDGKTAEAPMVHMSREICPECKATMDRGCTFVVEVRDGEQRAGNDNPYHTGRIATLNPGVAERMFGKHYSLAFMEESQFKQVFGDALEGRMTLAEVKEKSLEMLGVKFSHPCFSDNEYIYRDEQGVLRDEEGIALIEEEFWDLRKESMPDNWFIKED